MILGKVFYWTRILIVGAIGSILIGTSWIFLGASVLLLAFAPLLAPGASFPWSVFLVLCGVMVYTGFGLALDYAWRKDGGTDEG